MIRWLGFGHIAEEQLSAKYQNGHSRLTEIDDIQVHYRKEGSGEPIVLLHGLLSSLHTWDAWTEQLKEHYTVVRIDLPGFGFSTLPAGRELYSNNALLEVLNKLFTQLELTDIHIAGNSLGGYIAWNYALTYPEQVKTLTVVDPVCFSHKPPLLLRLAANPILALLGTRSIPKPLIDSGVSQVYAQHERIIPATRNRYFELLMRKGNKKNFFQVLSSLRTLITDKKLGQEIKQIAQPTLVMWGAQDTWIPAKLAYKWRKDLPHAVVKIYPNAGHVPMEEIPHDTAKDLAVFINKSSLHSNTTK